MHKSLYRKLFVLLLFSINCFANEPVVSFIAMDAQTGRVVAYYGDGVDERSSPCSTFKIALSLMGYDMELLVDEVTPEWNGCGPADWIHRSLVWYSQLLTPQIGLDRINDYLALFEYGNQEMDDDLLRAWLCSSLKISPSEQVVFLKKLACEELSVSTYATSVTKRLMFEEELEHGWRLYGKTETGGDIAWYVGWVERGSQTYVFALNIRQSDISISKIERKNSVKEFLRELCKGY